MTVYLNAKILDAAISQALQHLCNVADIEEEDDAWANHSSLEATLTKESNVARGRAGKLTMINVE